MPFAAYYSEEMSKTLALRLFLIVLCKSSIESNAEEITCGLSNAQDTRAKDIPKFVIGGRNVKPGEVPGYASLVIKSCVFGIFCQEAFCGASIWNKTKIITAAHCVSSDVPWITKTTVTVCIGAHENSNRANTTDGIKCYLSERILIHPEYNTNTITNDIAIIEIPDGMDVPKFTNNGYGSTNTFCAPKDISYVGAKCFVAGFGVWDRETKQLAPILQISEMVVIPNEECKMSYSDVTDNQVCARGLEGQTACNGDSGGPLFCVNEGQKFELIGDVSYGTRDCPQGYPVVYTRNSKYLDFIRLS
ncbi:hypothetical protein B4U79_07923 [Dinothrombium tinctorium]|uniref:Peptidase S1 domain-containing protein n=1 Tax=Dinothrombium tinctorium TaxID=1965070 RepID=A0A3S3PIG0_9ACAR|nr:hypothetical protein B4U79_07923 [Dinothrombium tinctorium]